MAILAMPGHGRDARGTSLDSRSRTGGSHLSLRFVAFVREVLFTAEARRCRAARESQKAKRKRQK
jgi:hypothetical protein